MSETRAGAAAPMTGDEMEELLSSMVGRNFSEIMQEHGDVLAGMNIEFGTDEATGAPTFSVRVGAPSGKQQQSQDARSPAEREAACLARLAASRRSGYIETKGRARTIERLYTSDAPFPDAVLTQTGAENGAQLAAALYYNAISEFVVYAVASVPADLTKLSSEDMLLLLGALERRAIEGAPAYAQETFFDTNWPQFDVARASALLARLSSEPRASILQSRASQIWIYTLLLEGLATHIAMNLSGAEEAVASMCEDVWKADGVRLPIYTAGDHNAYERALRFGATLDDVRPSATFYVALIERFTALAKTLNTTAIYVASAPLKSSARRTYELFINWALSQVHVLRPRTKPHCSAGSKCRCNVPEPASCCENAFVCHFLLPDAPFTCPCPRPSPTKMPRFDARTWTREDRVDGLLATLGHAPLRETIERVIARGTAPAPAATEVCD